eukprot:TRINITY_DN104045_c0_g1_i1.p1 TRINITY_DN104045_c0_g1~~TRINITY_DN104045_c0_g1_i1.p1  ORF type:complete len:277 (-),score=40.37 TRINITY_DN104045_c0_g1_i1:297-1127(-)
MPALSRGSAAPVSTARRRHGRGWMLLSVAAVASFGAHTTYWAWAATARSRTPHLSVDGSRRLASFEGAGPDTSVLVHAQSLQPCTERYAATTLMASGEGAVAPDDQIEVLYDGLCKVCLANKALLTSNDDRGVLRFVNIADDDYSPADHAGIEYEAAMDEIHIVLPGGQVLRGTEAVLRAYDEVGLGWAVGILSSPVLRSVTDAAYNWLSENRQTISKWVPGGEDLRERLRSARFLQKGIAEGEGCSEKEDDEDDGEDDDDDCVITDDKINQNMQS